MTQKRNGHEGKARSVGEELKKMRTEHEINLKNSMQMKKRLDTLTKENEELQLELKALRAR